LDNTNVDTELPDFSYQNGEKITKKPQNIPNHHETYQMVAKYSEWSLNIPTLYIPRTSKIYQNKDFWFKYR
jgi:hypothetical protein